MAVTDPMTDPMTEPKRFEDVELGDELPEEHPDVSMERVKKFAVVSKMMWGRFTDHEFARKEGFPAAIVPGIMSQGLLAAMIHRWAPGCRVLSIDTVFRTPMLVDSHPICKGAVTQLCAGIKIFANLFGDRI